MKPPTSNPEETLADLITCDLALVRERIEGWEAQAAALREQSDLLLVRAGKARMFFHDQGLFLESADSPDEAEERRELRMVHSEKPFFPTEKDLSGLSIAEATYRLLKAIPNHTLNGHTIVKLLQERGVMVGGQQPLATLITSLRRDDKRLEKVPNARNLWRIKPTYADAVAG